MFGMGPELAATVATADDGDVADVPTGCFSSAEVADVFCSDLPHATTDIARASNTDVQIQGSAIREGFILHLIVNVDDRNPRTRTSFAQKKTTAPERSFGEIPDWADG